MQNAFVLEYPKANQAYWIYILWELFQVLCRITYAWFPKIAPRAKFTHDWKSVRNENFWTGTWNLFELLKMKIYFSTSLSEELFCTCLWYSYSLSHWTEWRTTCFLDFCISLKASWGSLFWAKTLKIDVFWRLKISFFLKICA